MLRYNVDVNIKILRIHYYGKRTVRRDNCFINSPLRNSSTLYEITRPGTN